MADKGRIVQLCLGGLVGDKLDSALGGDKQYASDKLIR